MHRIEEPFYTTKDKGTGLGLMICRRIIEEHSGTMKISSKENQGTSVEVRFPIHKEISNHHE